MSIESEQARAQNKDLQTPVAAVQPTKASLERSRLLFLDNLRAVLIMLVIAGHVAIVYGSAGSWVYTEPTHDMVAIIILSIFTATGQAFIMGLFFLIAGYLTPGSYDRKGAAAFEKGRLLRLGIPLLIYDLFINPFVGYVATGFPRPYWEFYSDYLLHFGGIGRGPLWFVEALLIFSSVYVIWRWLSRHRIRNTASERQLPTYRAILLFIFALAVVTFVIRIWLPLGWTFEPLNFQLPFFAQYISFFVLGIIAYHRDWFLRIHNSMGRAWLWTAIGAILLLPIMILTGGGVEHPEFLWGGIHWQAFAYALWESIVCGNEYRLVSVLPQTRTSPGEMGQISGGKRLWRLYPPGSGDCLRSLCGAGHPPVSAAQVR
ncbi:MAG: acyltransferase family protein, partial [Ktedonobacteraceae bacterium]